MSTSNNDSTFRATSEEDPQPYLFELPPRKRKEPKIRPIQESIWTESKARLIQQYLYLFVQITKHGCYIDGFAGPQKQDKPETWAANLALDVTLLRRFHFFERSKNGLRELHRLRSKHSDRAIKIHPGDFNKSIVGLLVGRIRPSRGDVLFARSEDVWMPLA